MRTQVAIIGGGPSGLLLSQTLHRAGIDTVVLERRSKAHVLSRIRAGVLERGLVAQLEDAGLGARLQREGQPHDGTVLAHGEREIRIDFARHAAAHVTVYGQTEVTRDLYRAREAMDARLIFEVEDVVITGADGPSPEVSFQTAEGARTLACDYIAGCDGFHGVSRKTIPQTLRQDYEKVYPFGWLGVLSETPPVHDELIYATSALGFALCSMRNPTLSRYYIQCRLDDRPEAWSDDAFWDALRRRIPAAYAETLVTGPTIEKSIAPLRSFVTEPMQWGRLFLCGDAAHIVPPTGAKGLNTAASDVYYLSQALIGHYQDGDDAGLRGYSDRALARVWKAERFSWWMTRLLHRFPDQTAFDLKMQEAEVAFLSESEPAQAVLAENYVGLPY
ncbi:MAG: 4-hydroxybenzoate 3-monooxygenase [Pseudomonadota bacterium]